MKKMILVLFMVSILFTSTSSAIAGEMRTTFDDAWYGGLTGALIGGACLLFVDKPEENLNYIAYGFGAGVIVGSVFSVSQSRSALLNVDDGRLALNVPDLSIRQVKNDEKSYAKVSADILKISF